MASWNGAFIWILSFVGLPSVLGSSCLYYYTYYYYNYRYNTYDRKEDSNYLSCSGSCCGSLSSRYCCYNSIYTYYTISTGAIVGIVIGSLIGLGVFITVIICLCTQCCRKSRAGGGQVIRTTGQPVAYIHTPNQAGLQYSTPVGAHNATYSYSGTTNVAYTSASAPPPAYDHLVDNTSSHTPSVTSGGYPGGYEASGGGFHGSHDTGFSNGGHFSDSSGVGGGGVGGSVGGNVGGGGVND